MKTQTTARPIATLETVSPAMLEKIRAHEAALANFEKSRAALRAALIPAEGRTYRKPAPHNNSAAPLQLDNYSVARLIYDAIGTLYSSPAAYLIKKEKPAPRITSPAEKDYFTETAVATAPAPAHYFKKSKIYPRIIPQNEDIHILINRAKIAAENVTGAPEQKSIIEVLAESSKQDTQREKAAQRIDKEYARFENGQKKRRAAQAEREKTAAAAAEKIRAALNTEKQKTARRAALEEKQPIFEALDFETVKAAFTNKGTEVLNIALIAGASALKYALQKSPSDTFRAAYYSLVSYGISKTALQPDNSDACDVLQAAAVGIIEAAAAAGIPAEQYAKGLDQNGNPLELIIKVKQRDADGKPAKDSNGKTLYAERTITGPAVPRRVAIHAANKHIHKLKNRSSVQSFEHFSNGNSFDDPQKDKKLIDRQADFEKELVELFTAIKKELKPIDYRIIELKWQGFTQKEIAAALNKSQNFVSVHLATAKKSLYESGIFSTYHAAPHI